MIRVQRPAIVPTVLSVQGPVEAAKLRTEVLAGKTDLEFIHDLYAHADVKRALMSAQHEKCAFCESRFGAVSYGDVEHFRPKGGYRQRPGLPLKKPGYYWLAYAWDNLLISCELCNRSFKKNHFPIVKGTKRARAPHHNHTVEQALLIDPSVDDPRQHIEFRDHVARERQGSRRGRISVRRLGLNRRRLRHERERWLTCIRWMWTVATELPDTPSKADARQWLLKQVKPDAPYSAMALDFLRAQKFPGV